MENIHKSLLIVFSISLFGCGDDSQVNKNHDENSSVLENTEDIISIESEILKPNIPQVEITDTDTDTDTDIDAGQIDFSTQWTFNENGNYLTENYINYSPENYVLKLDASITYSESYEKRDSNDNKIYGFDDIAFQSIGSNEYLISNNTPDRISEVLIKSSSFREPIKVALDRPIQPFSRVRVVFQEHVGDVTPINTSGFFLPTITLTGDVSEAQATLCSTQCFSKPNEQQSEVYGILVSNLHKAMNHKSFLPEMIKFYRDDWCGVDGRNCNSDIANLFYLRMGVKGHGLDLKVLSGSYSTDGSGMGEIPSLSDTAANSNGWAAIWRNYITQGSDSWRPFARRTQETFFSKIANAYGFIYPFGMSEGGFSQRYASEFIGSNQYFPSQATTETREQTSSPIVAVLEEAGDKYLKYKLLKVDQDIDISTIRSRVITGERLGRKDRFSVESNQLFYELELDDFPEYAIVIQFYSDLSGNVFTTREFSIFYSQEGASLDDGSLTYFELPMSTTLGKYYNNINNICHRFIPDSLGATKDQYQLIWGSDNFNSETLKSRYFISSDNVVLTNITMPQLSYRIDMKNTNSFTLASPVSSQGVFSSEESILCVR